MNYILSHINFISYALLSCCLLFFSACTQAKEPEQPATRVLSEFIPDTNEVDAMILKKESFKEELWSNGKLVAVQKSILKFEVEGTLEHIFHKEGSYIRKNEAIAQLNAYQYKQALDDAKIALEKAQLEFEDMLIVRDYDLKKKEAIPEKIYQMVSLRSGYTEALQKVKKAEKELSDTRLIAPFDGKIASTQYKVHEQVSSGTEFLTLINDLYFEVEFYVTESEIDRINIGEHVNVWAAGPQSEFKGKVTVINPVVEENGTVLVKALVKNDGSLLEGMNVKVSIEKQIHNQFVIPKSAVLVRQDQQVLFKASKGKAYWTYVQTTNENKDYYAVVPDKEKNISALEVGDTIITKGHLTLAHDSKIMIKNLKKNKNPLGF